MTPVYVNIHAFGAVEVRPMRFRQGTFRTPEASGPGERKVRHGRQRRPIQLARSARHRRDMPWRVHRRPRMNHVRVNIRAFGAVEVHALRAFLSGCVLDAPTFHSRHPRDSRRAQSLKHFDAPRTSACLSHHTWAQRESCRTANARAGLVDTERDTGWVATKLESLSQSSLPHAAPLVPSKRARYKRKLRRAQSFCV